MIGGSLTTPLVGHPRGAPPKSSSRQYPSEVEVLTGSGFECRHAKALPTTPI